MTRENKLALVIGFGLILFVGILVSDHFSAQRHEGAQLAQSALARPSNQVEVQPLGQPTDVLNRSTGEAITLAPVGETPGGGPAPVAPAGTSQEPAGMPSPLPITIAMGDEEDGTPVRFYKVAAGDTLWKIAAREYGDGSLCKELAEYNKEVLKNSIALSPTQELRLPSLKKLRPTRMANSPAALAVGTKEPASSTAAPAKRTVTVAKGDTVYQLARKFNIKPQAIMAANGIRDAASLQPGQTLVIPSGNF